MGVEITQQSNKFYTHNLKTKKMKNWKQIKLAVAWIGNIISVVIASSGLLTFICVLGLIFYVVATQTHNGIFQASDSDRLFLLMAMCITAFMMLIGAVGFFKTISLIKGN
jgi:hypothetical protein